MKKDINYYNFYVGEARDEFEPLMIKIIRF